MNERASLMSRPVELGGYRAMVALGALGAVTLAAACGREVAPAVDAASSRLDSGQTDGGVVAADAAQPSIADLIATCQTIQGQTFGSVTITSTRRFEATTSSNGAGFCQVLASASPYLDIEVDVPDNWSGRLWQQGGSALDGKINSALAVDPSSGAVTAVNPALALKGAIYAASNGGNRASVPGQAAPAVWADGTANGQVSGDDYAYGAVGKTIKFAKAVAQTFFGRQPSRTYFNGCSNGGRNAYIAAQRWPDEYDGIVSGCQTMDMASQLAAWMNVAQQTGTSAALTPDQFKAAWTAALAACDSLDGVSDGIISNPQACAFDPAALQCGTATASADPRLCLSVAQVASLRAMLSDLHLSNGDVLYSRFSWADFSVSSPYFGALGSGFALLATNDPAWLTAGKWATFEMDRDYYVFATGLARRGADQDKMSVAAFVASGKKLISWHDGADNLVSPNDHLRNYSTMVNIAKAMGLANPDTNTRFFIVPGGVHAQGQTLLEVDWATAIMDWVEKGTAPEQLTFFFKLGTTARSLPVCRYPHYPQYDGSGDVSVASSYACK